MTKTQLNHAVQHNFTILLYLLWRHDIKFLKGDIQLVVFNE